ncbi:DNA polymerase delta subunit 3 isoform 2 [Mus musculus]|uniref:DNA polymerase delta subunit 3 n=3 Tax=Mus musculus TaxID=10090 RepID=DPOD3_MOUSE|nr:DNA polymerase delta subunit 3 isoform 2 [Mus musculus]Q9EQ28.2 RecName: Full=DNA polymerase delta subunit 3; AltName: Full=DNA polymerase delta subunit p66 [Mus musculus]EDL16422.1 polymerase (DNA-directed), delta 3, accessory subunit, isoform CRA_c [Mus musculus]|eukprot:XP_006508212.2 PREDICTED: DNA polymerase delta subunit 3 isoform X1 [Mus musculus]
MAEQLYLENIDEFVTDQNKIVTYKWLSYTLGVHVNQAKQMLYEYVERKRKENSGAQLHVTYLVSGSLIQNGHSCHKVAVVREDKLEAVKSKLAVTASIHVYSIQKAMLKDSGPLFNTDYDILKSNLQNCSKFSAIQCAAAVPRAPAESPSSRKYEQSNLQAASEAQASELTTNGHGPPASKQASQQPKGIMGMLISKAATKTQDTNKETKPEAREVTSASSAGGKAPGKGSVMSNFFGKAAMNKLKVNLDSEQAVKEEKTVEQPPVSVTEPKLAAPPAQKKSSRKSEPGKVQQKEKSSRGKRVDLSDEEAKETEHLKKKRRRIKLPQSDSSEDEVFEDSPEMYEADSPSPPPVSPPPDPMPKTEPPPVKRSSGETKRRRKRVLKSKTFVDEEGCIVTEKVYESESCTDSEEELKMKPASAHKPPAAAVKREPREERKGPKKGAAALGKANRQVSITGFFQKK